MALYEVVLVRNSSILVDAPNEDALNNFIDEHVGDITFGVWGEYGSDHEIKTFYVQDLAMYQDEDPNVTIDESGEPVEED